MSNVTIFDRKLLRQHKNRMVQQGKFCNFLFQEAFERMNERLYDFNKSFDVGLSLGINGVDVNNIISPDKIAKIYSSTISDNMAKEYGNSRSTIADEELIPFATNSFDIIISTLNLHWVNDLPGSLAQLHHTLKEDGMIIASMFGIETLRELKQAIMASSIENNQAVTPRISPFIDIRDASALLQRTNYKHPVADSELITVNYANAFDLIKELHYMGESNKLLKRHDHFITRGEIAKIAEKYHELFADDEGRINATFEIVTMTGWK
jgi:SAM-dependent methyltransferase